jgi:hypothetical protein
MVQGPVFVADFQKDMDQVHAIICIARTRTAFKDPHMAKHPAPADPRPVEVVRDR